MTTRVNVNSIRPKSSGTERIVVPWESSGIFDDSAVIKNAPGVFGGIVVNFTWGIEGLSLIEKVKFKLKQLIRVAIGGPDWPGPKPDPKWWPPPWWLIVWDSPDADTTDDVVLACYPFPSGAYLGTTVSTNFPMVGIYAHLGIYVEVSYPGDVEYSVYYR